MPATTHNFNFTMNLRFFARSYFVRRVLDLLREIELGADFAVKYASYSSAESNEPSFVNIVV
jgi:hypothetical protein